jgi:ribulose-5-phosphate 4-epimerase/fuculose-1-phosphate aldolase
MPFDGKRIICGGVEMIVKASALRWASSWHSLKANSAAELTSVVDRSEPAAFGLAHGAARRVMNRQFKEGTNMSAKSIAQPRSDAIPHAEWNVRVDLAACYRLVALYGWDDLIFTHISARVPGPEHHFLINPYGMMFEEITASSLVKIGLDGKPIGNSPFPINPAGFTIHSAIHEIREDAGCVMHLHTLDGTAVSTSKERLLPLNQTAQLVLPDLAYHEYEGVALDHDERPRLQKDLGNKNLMLLHNHGTLAVGKTCADAFLRMYLLERACTMQVRTRMLGDVSMDHPTERAVIDKNAELTRAGGMWQLADKLVWPALLRKLDRIGPDFRT